MFHSARVKLAAWYLLIIMVVSLSFSTIIFAGVSADLRHRFDKIESQFRLDPRFRQLPPNAAPGVGNLREELVGARTRVLIILLGANGAILVFSAAAGYFLAGRTLKPIEEALDEQKRFVADASHELRTPLTALRTSIEVALRDPKLTKKAAADTLRGSLDDIAMIQSLTSDLLSLASGDGIQTAAMEPTDLAAVLDKTVRAMEPIAKDKDISFDAGLEPAALDADKQGLEKLAFILIDNAIKYTPAGGSVSIKTATDRNQAVLTVKDTGIGISASALPHIFDRFYRVDQSRSKVAVPGFGLGLSIAKKIVDEHGGSIYVDSSIGQGTSVTVRLPSKNI